MLARLKTSAISGIEGMTIDVEVDVRLGQNRFTIIGLGDSAVKESRDRVTHAIQNLGFKLPNIILVNLAPAELRKEGSVYDLAIAIGVLLASRQIKVNIPADTFLYGEISLDGKLKPIKGLLALVVSALEAGARRVIVPRQNFKEASLVRGLEVIPLSSLAEVVRFLQDETYEVEYPERALPPRQKQSQSLSDVCGQGLAKRAMMIAASGGHNLLMIGPPGCGKSMLASRFAGLLPPLSEQECLEVVRIHSVAGLPIAPFLDRQRPYRNPHHVVSDIGLIGGGTLPKPGEISLAHQGVLFLDEFPEYRRSALEALRAPLENGTVQITRSRASYTFPANFQLIAAMNPCPCGRLGVPEATCMCSRQSIQNYLKKLSEPILDRIDLHVELDAVPFSEMQFSDRSYKSDADMLGAIFSARERQLRLRNKVNAQVRADEINRTAVLKDEALQLVEKVSKQVSMSARSIVRVLRVALTIADLDSSDQIKAVHVAEALNFRRLERLRQYAGAI